MEREGVLAKIAHFDIILVIEWWVNECNLLLNNLVMCCMYVSKFL